MFLNFWPKTPELCHSNRDGGLCDKLESTTLCDGAKLACGGSNLIHSPPRSQRLCFEAIAPAT